MVENPFDQQGEQVKALQEKLRLYQAVFETTSEGVLVTDQVANILLVNNAFSFITGYSQDEVVGKNPRLLKSGRHDVRFYEQMWDSLKVIDQWQGEIHNRRKDGIVFPAFLNIVTLRNEQGDVSYYLGLLTDLTTQKDDEEFFKYVATHDQLTDLPNRSWFYDCLNNAVFQAKINNLQMAVLFIDLDGFKRVNDTFGHEVGDRVLIEVASRLVSCVYDKKSVARMGGDEFTIILENISGPQQAAFMAESILKALSLPFSTNGNQIYLTASIGISIYPAELENPEKLLIQADQAMYRTKELGKSGYKFFNI